MNSKVTSTARIGTFTWVFLASISIFAGCAELDRLTKPRVQGLQQAAGFDSAALIEGGIGNTQVRSSLPPGDEINLEALDPVLERSIIGKRRDVDVSVNGRYRVSANVIANDVSNRADDIEATSYKWTSRRVKVNYVVLDSMTEEQVWAGIIETSAETVATYEKKEDEKTRDKVADAVVAAITKNDPRPYPEPPLFGDVVKRNFEGFALNLPFEK